MRGSLPIDINTIPACISMLWGCKIIMIAYHKWQIWPKLLGVFNFLTNFLHQLIKRWFSTVCLATWVTTVWSLETTAITVACTTTITTATIILIIIAWELYGLIVDFLVVAITAIFLLIARIGCSPIAIRNHWLTCWLFNYFLLTIVNKEISICVIKWNGTTLTTELGCSTALKNSLANVITWFLDGIKSG